MANSSITLCHYQGNLNAQLREDQKGEQMGLFIAEKKQALNMAYKMEQEHLESNIHTKTWHNIDGLVQERHNSTANALGLRLSGTNPSI